VRLFLLLPAALLLLLAVACGDEGEGGEVEATLDEWSITLDEASLEEGSIDVTVENEGEREHELVIVSTEIAIDELPTKDDGSFDEDAPGVDVKEEIEDIEDGERTGRTYSFDPGTYVFLCNIVEDIDGTETSHFAQGMRVAFEVTEKE
jgi:hypothetical protein